VPLPETTSKQAAIRNSVAEPLRMYRWLLAPETPAHEYDAGARIARDEMKGYKPIKEAVDGILDSMSKVDALYRRKKDPDTKKEIAERNAAAERRFRQSIDPVLGVPMVA
jgi:hypothetical protein